jgi:hypothetical protein
MKRARGAIIDALVGRKIVKAECERWDGAQDGSAPIWVHTWTLTLDSGAKVSFIAEETEVGAYGVDIRVTRAA